MAIASIKVICEECGNEFNVRKNCYNRTEANRYEEWATQNITLCPTCAAKAYSDHQSVAVAEKLEAHSLVLPTISGASEKQIKFASDLRMKYLGKNLSKIDIYAEIAETLSDEARMAQIAETCAAAGMTVEAALAENYEAYGLNTIKLIFDETSARKLIDACR